MVIALVNGVHGWKKIVTKHVNIAEDLIAFQSTIIQLY